MHNENKTIKKNKKENKEYHPAEQCCEKPLKERVTAVLCAEIVFLLPLKRFICTFYAQSFFRVPSGTFENNYGHYPFINCEQYIIKRFLHKQGMWALELRM